MRRRPILIAGGVATLVAAIVVGGVATSQAATNAPPKIVDPPAVSLAASPYIYPVTGGKDPVAVMRATGVKAFTLAFILSNGGCTPVWDGAGGLTAAGPINRINAIRRAGGDVVISIGGASGTKLGNKCGSAAALAGAYQKVINAYKLRAIDIDLEAGEVSQSTKVLGALKIIKRNNPSVQTIITLGVGMNGLEGGEARIPGQAAAIGSPVDVWSIMPFDFCGSGTPNMTKATISASEGLHRQLKAALKESDAKIYSRQGISSMNGHTDCHGENVTVKDFQNMLGYEQQHHLARFTFWELNRDGNLQYTKVIAQYKG
jgi:chitinase